MSKKKHIILIDDEEVIHMSFEMMLFDSSYSKTSIIDPQEAMQYVQNKDQYDKPDLFIIDLILSKKISGVDVITAIRKDPSFANIPIILFTGYREQIINEDELLEALNIACVLPKMLLTEEILFTIDSLFKPIS
jgi:CheY-like chemotaxis protein